MRQWMHQHKWLTGIGITLCLVLAGMLLCFSYIWSKLSLIQYDDGSASPKEPDTYQEETAPGEDILEKEDVTDLEKVAVEPVLPDSPIWQDSDVLNILLIGTDERSDSFSDNARSDSMILVSINKETKQVKLVSLERAIGVPVLEGQYEGQYDWLTHIFRYGGAELLLKTVQTCFLVDVEYYVRVNFSTVIHAIDALGGIDIELTQAEADFLNDPDASYMWLGREKQSVTAGMNHLNGTAALTYARIRKIDSDWQRVERQRKVIVAVIDDLKASGFMGVDALADQMLPLVQTNFTQLELAGLLLYAPTFADVTVEQLTIPQAGTYGIMNGMGGRTLYAVNFEESAEALHDFLYGTPEAESTGK